MFVLMPFCKTGNPQSVNLFKMEDVQTDRDDSGTAPIGGEEKVE